MDFRVLGPVEVWNEGTSLFFRRRQQRLILGILAIDVGRAVPVDRLIDLLWGERPPSQARSTVHTRISELRAILATALHPGQGAELLTRHGSGYALEVGADDVDAHRFRKLLELARSRGSDAEARDALDAAIQLWRGPVLGGWLPRESHAALFQGLESARVTALEDLYEIELRLGRHREVVDRIVEASALNTNRERLTALAMLALHRADRTPEALHAYERYRRWAKEDLGIDPGSPLQELYLSILRNDPKLIVDTTTPELGQLTHDEVIVSQIGTPNTLPSDIPDFVAREAMTAQVMALLMQGRSGVPTVVVAGPAGVGKTALSIHVAHQLRQHFSDGQLYADLHGAEWQHPPTSTELLARFLRALGAQNPLPDSLDERMDMYRRLLAGRHVLIVLDNAANADQVLPLIPGSPTCAVLVNSRVRFGPSLAAEVIDLRVLETAQAVDLLASIAGRDRVDREPEASTNLVHLCGCLPLAIRVAAAKLAAKTHWKVEQIVSRLADERRRLDQLAHEHMSVRSSIGFSYASLSPAAQRMLRLLGDTNHPDVNIWSAAALLDTRPTEAEELLEQLHDAQLIDIAGAEANGYARYRLHDLVRLFAAERAVSEESAMEIDAARSRVFGAWLYWLEEVERRVVGGNYMSIRSPAQRWPVDTEFLDGAAPDPLRLFDNERLLVLHMIRRAGEVGHIDHCWGLAVASSPLFQMRSYYDDWPTVLDIAHTAAIEASDDLGLAAILNRMGTLSGDHLAHEQARIQFRAAKALCDRLGECYGRAIATAQLAVLDRYTGRQAEALAGLKEALPGLREADDRIAEAFILRNIGQVLMECGSLIDSEDYFDQALTLARLCGSQRAEAQIYLWQGMLRQKQERYKDAEQLFARVLEVTRGLGDQGGQAQALHSLGVCYKAQGNSAAAYGVLRQALPLVARPRPTRLEALVRQELADLAE